MTTMKDDYIQYVTKRDEINQEPLGGIIFQQEKRYVHPFRLCGNVWYVGDSWVCVHLIDTGNGLLLLDGGNCGATAMLIQAIWEAGFNPADVKWMVLSHGHFDHFGGANFFRNMFGTKIFLSEPDSRMFREKPYLSHVQNSRNYADELFAPDVEIHDDEIIDFGGLPIHFYMVPGHTEGCIAAFFNIKDGDTLLRAGYYGGFGFNTLTKEHLAEAGDTELTMRNTYLQSLEKVRHQHVDVFLGNHCVNNETLMRRQMQINNPTINPFIDSTLWGKYLDDRRDALIQFMNDPANQ